MEGLFSARDVEMTLMRVRKHVNNLFFADAIDFEDSTDIKDRCSQLMVRLQNGESPEDVFSAIEDQIFKKEGFTFGNLPPVPLTVQVTESPTPQEPIFVDLATLAPEAAQGPVETSVHDERVSGEVSVQSKPQGNQSKLTRKGRRKVSSSAEVPKEGEESRSSRPASLSKEDIFLEALKPDSSRYNVEDMLEDTPASVTCTLNMYIDSKAYIIKHGYFLKQAPVDGSDRDLPDFEPDEEYGDKSWYERPTWEVMDRDQPDSNRPSPSLVLAPEKTSDNLVPRRNWAGEGQDLAALGPDFVTVKKVEDEDIECIRITRDEDPYQFFISVDFAQVVLRVCVQYVRDKCRQAFELGGFPQKQLKVKEKEYLFGCIFNHCARCVFPGRSGLAFVEAAVGSEYFSPITSPFVDTRITVLTSRIVPVFMKEAVRIVKEFPFSTQAKWIDKFPPLEDDVKMKNKFIRWGRSVRDKQINEAALLYAPDKLEKRRKELNKVKLSQKETRKVKTACSSWFSRIFQNRAKIWKQFEGKKDLLTQAGRIVQGMQDDGDKENSSNSENEDEANEGLKKKPTGRKRKFESAPGKSTKITPKKGERSSKKRLASSSRRKEDRRTSKRARV